MTLLLNANLDADLAHAVELLRAGALVAVPTETVYGLAADASQPDAVRGIFAAKQRPSDHPLIVHIGHVEQLERWAARVPTAALQLAQHFWPGPLTLVLHRAPAVDQVVTGGRDTVALRMPAHPALLNLLAGSGLAVAAPSANPHKALSPTSADQVMATMGGKISAVLDGGECTLGIESTILDLTSPAPRVLRAGPITASELADHLGCAVAQPREHTMAMPGNLPVHYRPRKPLRLKTAPEVQVDPGYPVVRLLLSDPLDQANASFAFTRVMPRSKTAFARILYRALYEADQSDAQEIWVESPPLEEHWLDVHDRLMRACSR